MPETNQAELMRIFQFTDADLQENRNGRLSGPQIRRLRSNASISLYVLIGAGVVFMSAFMLGWGRPLREIPIPVWAFFLGLFPLIGLFLFWLQRRDYARGVVECLRGLIEIEAKNFRYILTLQGQQLIVAFDIRKLIVENAFYRIYYLPANRQIMSIEAAQPGDPAACG